MGDMSQAIEPFSKRLRELRVERGMSQQALANQIGISKVTIWHWEKGQTLPRPKTLRLAAEALAVPPEQLMIYNTPDALPEIPAEPAVNGPPAQGHPPLAAFMADAKRRIAEVAGTDPAKVTISVDY